MKKMLTQTTQSAMILLIALVALSPNIHAQIDLELSMTQSVESPNIWSNYSVDAKIENKGSVTAQNVRIKIPNPAGTIYQGGNEFSASQGSFSPYGTEVWAIASIPANGSATLKLNYFVKDNDVAATWGQVTQASPNDIDSTPGNGTAPNVNEDDEAISSGDGGNPGGDRADLKLSDIQVSSSGLQGTVVNFTLDLQNIGTATAAGDYQIKILLSTTPGTGGGTTQVGVINTGNTPIGTIQNVQGAVSIPANYPEGSEYLVFFVDANNDVAESDENNNKRSKAFTITTNGGSGGDFCGFQKTYIDLVPPASGQNPATQTVSFSTETNADAYTFKIRQVVAPFTVAYTDLTIDNDGNQVSVDPNAPEPAPATQTLESGATYTSTSIGDNSFRIKVTSATGAVLFDKTYNNVTDDPGVELQPRVTERPGGYYLSTSWRRSNNGVVNFVLITLNASGNQIDYFQETFDFDSQSFGIIKVLDNGEILMTRENTSTKTIYLRKMNANGLIWENIIIGDLVSNRVPQLTHSESQNALYILVFQDPFTRVRKIDPNSGELIWETNLLDEFNAETSTIRVFNRTFHMLVTESGEVVTAYRYSNPLGPDGVEYGKLKADGTLAWWRGLGEDFNIRIVGETSDGGFLFAGREENKFTVIKVGNDGELSPACSGGPSSGGDIDLSLTLTASGNPEIWTNFSTTLTIRNDGPQAATGVKVRLTNPSGVIYQGGNEGSTTQGNFNAYGNLWNVGNLPAGATATLFVNYFIKSTGDFQFYAQVSAANEEDGDSTPDNGTPGTVNEDDEALFNTTGFSMQNRIVGNTDQQRPFLLRNIFPNPSMDGQVNISLTSKDDLPTALHLYDARGKIVKSQEIFCTKGANTFEMNVEQLPSGLYFLRIEGTSAKQATGRFFVEHK